MSVIEPDYLATLQANPQQPVDVIITTTTNPKPYLDHIKALGLTVTKTYSLISAVAATGSGEAVMVLSNEPWIKRIEPDRPVHTAG